MPCRVDARFFDWDSWRVDVGASDHPYMMAVHWYPDRHRRFERAWLAVGDLVCHDLLGC